MQKKKSKNEAARELDITAALSNITKEKSISMDLVLDSLKDALISAAKRYIGEPVNVESKVDREKGTIEVYTRREVVEEVYDPESQISLEEAKQLDDELEVGDELIEDLDVNVFGRTAIQTAKQVIIQRVREAERQKIFVDYSDRIGELITGTVQQIDKGNILVNIGRTEALLPYREQIRKERYRQGDTIRACLTEVRDNAKGPQIIVSRTCPEFLARLFELEVPEIFDKTVRIVKVVRDPGNRSKIAVSTTDERVDPVGACVGMRGNRVQAIVRELSNERIDIINWTSELSVQVRRVFSPAEVKRVHPVGDSRIVVIIKEEYLAQAIGKEGQNIRLASRLLDKEIDVYGDEEFASMTEEERNEALAEFLEDEELEPGEESSPGGEQIPAESEDMEDEPADGSENMAEALVTGNVPAEPEAEIDLSENAAAVQATGEDLQELEEPAATQEPQEAPALEQDASANEPSVQAETPEQMPEAAEPPIQEQEDAQVAQQEEIPESGREFETPEDLDDKQD
ncbi:MAG: transcription termination factor NusA [Chitinivibrionales bacterium]|nr:transcription termination factor NusA [Chitinivibrionales bacterium]